MTSAPPPPGYLTSHAYPVFFHREQAPVWVASVAAALGAAVAPARRWCEIGCGQGFGAAVLAAANPGVEFVGIDLNPDHIAAAQARAQAAGLTNLRFICADIRAAPAVEGPFDLIACHGVLSWVGADVRQSIARFIGDRLAPGGVAVLHYMAEPGGAAFRAFHSVFRSVVHLADPVAEGLRLLVAMRDAQAGFFQLHPHASGTLDSLLREPPAYVAHEYLNPEFHPMGFAEISGLMAGAGLRWLGSALPGDNIDAFSLPEAAAKVVTAVADPVLREVLKDLARNTALRCDLFLRPSARLQDSAHLELLRQGIWAVVPGAPSPAQLTFGTRIGPVEADARIYKPLLHALAQGPQSFAQVEARRPFTPRPGLLNQALQIALWAGIAHPLVPMDDPAPAARLNRLLVQAAAGGETVPALAAPSLGSGLPVDAATLAQLAKGGGDPLLRGLFWLDD